MLNSLLLTDVILLSANDNIRIPSVAAIAGIEVNPQPSSRKPANATPSPRVSGSEERSGLFLKSKVETFFILNISAGRDCNFVFRMLNETSFCQLFASSAGNEVISLPSRFTANRFSSFCKEAGISVSLLLMMLKVLRCFIFSKCFGNSFNEVFNTVIELMPDLLRLSGNSSNSGILRITRLSIVGISATADGNFLIPSNPFSVLAANFSSNTISERYAMLP